MSTAQRRRINLSAPNLMNICVDEKRDGEICGRIYHCYRKDPIPFSTIVELIREAEGLFDQIGFPQAATKARSFTGTNVGLPMRPAVMPEKIYHQEEVAAYRGEKGTFVTSVRLRQNSTWQGDFYWVEQDEIKRFRNTLEFIKEIDTAVE